MLKIYFLAKFYLGYFQNPKKMLPFLKKMLPILKKCCHFNWQHFGMSSELMQFPKDFLEILISRFDCLVHFFIIEFYLSENMIFIFLPFLANALNITGHGRLDVQGRFWETTYNCKGKNVKILVTRAL